MAAKKKPKKRKPNPARANDVQLAERVAFTAKLMTEHASRHEITKIVCKKFKIGWRQAERYQSDARALAVEMTNRPTKDHLAEHVEFLRAIMFNPKVGARNQLVAQKQLMKLLGLRNDPEKDQDLLGRAELVVDRLRQIQEQTAGWRPPAVTVLDTTTAPPSAEPEPANGTTDS